MPTTTRARRIAWTSLIAVLLVAGLAACTPRQVRAYIAVTSQHYDVLTWDQLRELRECESGGDYSAIGGGGLFRGAYQFRQRTWNGVARRWYPWLVGQDPARADSWWQDAMARALWAEQGPAPWDGCGPQVA